MPKFYRPRMENNMALYSHIFGVLWVILLAAITPLWLLHSPALMKSEHSASTLQSKVRSPWIISIVQEGQYCLSKGKKAASPMPLDRLKTTLTQNMKLTQSYNRAIWLKVNPDVHYSAVQEVMQLLQSLGIQQIGVVTAAPKPLISS